MHVAFGELVRVYFNRGGEPEKTWSVDTGPGTVEYLTGKVNIVGCRVTFDRDLTVVRNDLAKAWAQVEKVILVVVDEKNYITILPDLAGTLNLSGVVQ